MILEKTKEEAEDLARLKILKEALGINYDPDYSVHYTPHKEAQPSRVPHTTFSEPMIQEVSEVPISTPQQQYYTITAAKLVSTPLTSKVNYISLPQYSLQSASNTDIKQQLRQHHFTLQYNIFKHRRIYMPKRHHNLLQKSERSDLTDLAQYTV